MKEEIMIGQQDVAVNGAADTNGKAQAAAPIMKETSVEVTKEAPTAAVVDGRPKRPRRAASGKASPSAEPPVESPPSPETPAPELPAPEVSTTAAPSAAPAQAGIFAILRPGTVIGFPTRVFGVLPIRHVGIISDELGPDGKPKILHASNIYGAAVETTWSDFLWRALQAPTLDGYPSELSPAEVVTRARARLGQPYSIASFNCEIYVAFCHGMTLESPQFEAWKRRALSVTEDPWGRTRAGSSFLK